MIENSVYKIHRDYYILLPRHSSPDLSKQLVFLHKTSLHMAVVYERRGIGYIKGKR